MWYLIYVIIFSILLLTGAASVFLMVFPSLPLMFIIAIVFAFVDKFQHLGGWDLVILGGIAVLAEVIDYVSGIFGAKMGGASKASIIWGLIGFIIGMILFPPFGGLIGLFAGILIVELVFFKDYIKAIKAASGGLLGSLGGTMVKFILAILFLILFIIFALS